MFSELIQSLVARTETTDANGRVNPYGYLPTLGVCVLFVVIYGLSTALHFVQGIHKRQWFLLYTITIGAAGETLGWAGRLWSSRNVYKRAPFIIQILATFISPTFIAATNFVILGRIISQLGPQYSRLAPQRYAQIFVSIDVIALIIQALGGGVASAAVLNNKSTKPGSHIMLIGIIIGVLEIATYVTLAVDFFQNYSRRHVVRQKVALKEISMRERGPDAISAGSSRFGSDSDVTAGGGRMTGPIKKMSYALVFSTLMLLGRALYRTVALGAGFSSSINHSQTLFDVLDGMFIALATVTLNFFHPGYLL